MPRRKRCFGPCDQLYDPATLTQVAKGEWLCEDCLALAGEHAAQMPGEQGTRLRTAAARKKAGTSDPGADQDVGPLAGVLDDAAKNPGDTQPDASPGDTGAVEAAQPDPTAPTASKTPGADSSDSQPGEGAAGTGPAAPTLLRPDETTREQLNRELDQIGAPPLIPASQAPPVIRERSEPVFTPSVIPAGWPLKKPHVSASALATFAKCPEQFRQRYVLGRRTAFSGAGLAGTALHKALEANWRHKMAQGEDLPLPLAGAAYDDALDTLIEENGGPAEINWGTIGRGAQKQRATADVIREQGRPALNAYLTEIAPAIQPLEVEQFFKVTVDGSPVPLLGYIDLITTDAIVDTKFGGKVQSEVDAGWMIQGLVYLRARDLPMVWHSVSWAGKWNTDLTLPRSAANYQLGGDVVRRYIDAILAYTERFGVGETWPGAITHMWACDYCDFKRAGCEWWNPRMETLL